MSEQWEPKTRHQKRIAKELQAKRYTVTGCSYEPIGVSMEMIGETGGWMVDFSSESGADDIWGRTIDEVLDKIAALPDATVIAA